MKLFFDTSAFIKRYIDEPGSVTVESLCALADDVAVSIILPIEVIATFSRLKREKRISEDHYRRMKASLFDDLRDITILSVTPSVVGHSVVAIEGKPLKALDAVHIGCAIDFKPDYFVSADKQQLAAAEHCALKIKTAG
jgi:predicted nucleic acid-binding protein